MPTNDTEKKFKTIAKLLEIPIFKLDGEACATFKLNNYQHIFIRLDGYAKKGYAQISVNHEILGCKERRELWLQSDMERFSIEFSKDKAPEKIAQDIKRRILESDFAKEQLSYLKNAVAKHNENVAWFDKRKQLMNDLGYQVRGYLRDQTASIRETEEITENNFRHFSVEAKLSSNSLEVSGLTDLQYSTLLKQLAEWSTQK